VIGRSEGSRLNVASGVIGHAGEPDVADAMGIYLEHAGRAIENRAAFRLELGGNDDDDTTPIVGARSPG
jgi:hypothetical protein